MSEKIKAIMAWSGGKDSSYCLNEVLNDSHYEVTYLLTTLNAEFKRISMHGVKEELLDAQSESLSIPLIKVWIHEGTYEEYDRQMEAALLKAKSEGIETVIFGDIFLEDLRKYREDKLASVGMKAVFPLWKRNTTDLVNDFISKGFRTYTCCVNDAYFGEDAVGKEITPEFISSFPSKVDPCGENGEFHTLCFAGPLFKKAIPVVLGEKVYKPIPESSDDDCGVSSENKTKGFWYCEMDLKYTEDISTSSMTAEKRGMM